MGLETGTYVNDLNTANPVGTDAKSQGDDHLRLIKTCLKNSFPFSTMGTGLMKANGAAAAVTVATAGTDYLAPPSGTAMLKANSGAALANATAGTDYVAPGTATSFTAKQTFGNTIKIDEVLERVTITASAPSGTFDCLTQSIQYFTTNASANWTQNFRGDGSNTLDSIMAVGESITVTVLAAQGATPYWPSAHQIDGSAKTPLWLGSTPTGGDASSTNVYTYTIIKTAAATFTLLASKSKYA